MSFRERVVRAMEINGMSQADVCRESGLSSQLLSKIIVGKTENPRADTIVALAHALNVDFNYLLGWGDGNAD